MFIISRRCNWVSSISKGAMGFGNDSGKPAPWPCVISWFTSEESLVSGFVDVGNCGEVLPFCIFNGWLDVIVGVVDVRLYWGVWIVGALYSGTVDIDGNTFSCTASSSWSGSGVFTSVSPSMVVTVGGGNWLLTLSALVGGGGARITCEHRLIRSLGQVRALYLPARTVVCNRTACW